MDSREAFQRLLERGKKLYRTTDTEQAVANLDAVPPRWVPKFGEGEEPKYTIVKRDERVRQFRRTEGV